MSATRTASDSRALRWSLPVVLCLGLTACSPREAHVGSALLLLVVAHAWLASLVFLMPPRWGHAARAGATLIALGLAAFGMFWATFLAPGIAPSLAAVVLILPAALALLRWKRRVGPAQDLLGINAILLPSLVLACLVLWSGLHPFDWEGDDWTLPAGDGGTCPWTTGCRSWSPTCWPTDGW